MGVTLAYCFLVGVVNGDIVLLYGSLLYLTYLLACCCHSLSSEFSDCHKKASHDEYASL